MIGGKPLMGFIIKNRFARLDAILIHTYWYDINKINSLNLSNKIQALALKNICQNLEVKNIIITAGRVSQKQIAIGYQLKKQILSVLPKKLHSRVQIYPSQKTTVGEIKEFKEISQAQNWNRLGSLGVCLHLPRIKRDFVKVFKNDKHNILFFEAEKNLSKKDFPALEKYRNSKEYTLLKLNEQIEKSIENIPIIGTIFLEIVSKFSVNKGHLQPKILNFFYKISNIKTKSKFKHIKNNL